MRLYTVEYVDRSSASINEHTQYELTAHQVLSGYDYIWSNESVNSFMNLEVGQLMAVVAEYNRTILINVLRTE